MLCFIKISCISFTYENYTEKILLCQSNILKNVNSATPNYLLFLPYWQFFYQQSPINCSIDNGAFYEHGGMM